MAKKKTLSTTTSSSYEVEGGVLTPSNEGIVIELGGISEITTDFGRADLNELSAKVNEIVRKVNG